MPKCEYTKLVFELHEFGTLKIKRSRNGFEWNGRMRIQQSDMDFELIIEVDKKDQPSGEKVEQVRDFLKNWPELSDILYQYMADSFRNSKWEKSANELREMYHLSLINLKRDNTGWWVVFEPKIHVDTIFNFLPRFTIEDKEITWSNLK